MIAGIQHDVSTYNLPPEYVPWFRRLEDKLRRVYTMLTCSGVADVVPRQPTPRSPRHSTPTPDAYVSPSDQYTSTRPETSFYTSSA